MIPIDKPNISPKDVYGKCINSVSDQILRTKFAEHSDFISNISKTYDSRAKKGKLFNFYPDNTNDLFKEFSPITKRDWNLLYSQQMVIKTKPAREIYDKLISLAPIGICPLCGFGHASTLDHYLAKSKFPLFSVLPFNLVPACKDCNTGKGNKVAITAGQQTIHPYYDRDELVTEQWLFARVIEDSPVSIHYFVDTPRHWRKVLRERAVSHFMSFDLAKRYSIQAANELSSLNPRFSTYMMNSYNSIKDMLNEIANIEYNNHKNSWKTAMYQALANSSWYCSEGFLS
jgi:RNA recognition motif-containing protein